MTVQADPPRRAERGWVRWGAVAAVLGALAATLLLLDRHEAVLAGRALAHADSRWVLVVGLGLIGWWIAWIGTAAGTRSAVGLPGRAHMASLAPVVVASVSLNSAVKSGGLAGLGAHLGDARRRGLPTAPVAAAYLLGALLADAAFSATLLGALALLLVQGQLTTLDLLAVVAFAVVLALKVGALIAAVRSPGVLQRIQRGASVTGRWVRRMARRDAAEPTGGTAGADFSGALAIVAARPRAALGAFAAAIGIDVMGVVMLWASVAAVGGGDRPGTALTVYAISGLFGILGLLPGGLGFVEVGAATGLVAAGVPLGAAAAAVALFRFAEFWVPLVAGAGAGLILRRAHSPAGARGLGAEARA